MAGTLVGISNTQQHDVNGAPLSNCLLTVFTGGTTTPALTYQDIGLAIPAQNPLVGDSSGRIPLFFVADGTYHVRLTDQFGIMSNGGFDIPQLPSIGASSSGGGGAVVDPTTVASTGDLKWRLENTIIPGWVRINGRTIGNASSGASERANADTQALWIYIYQTFTDAMCPVLGGRGANALSDYNGNKQITLLDARDRSLFGLDDMGNAALNGFASTAFQSGSAIIPGSKGGALSSTLVPANLPPQTPAGTIANGAITSPNAYPTIQSPNNNNGGGGGTFAGVTSAATTVTATQAASTFTGTPFAGQTSTPFPIAPSFLLGTLFWKL